MSDKRTVDDILVEWGETPGAGRVDEGFLDKRILTILATGITYTLLGAPDYGVRALRAMQGMTAGEVAAAVGNPNLVLTKAWEPTEGVLRKTVTDAAKVAKDSQVGGFHALNMIATGATFAMLGTPDRGVRYFQSIQSSLENSDDGHLVSGSAI